jgi:hypothetical protein
MLLNFIGQTAIRAGCHTLQTFGARVRISGSYLGRFIEAEFLGFHGYYITFLVADTAIFAAIGVQFNFENGVPV